MAMQRGACGAVARFACEAIWGMLPPQNLWRSSWIPGSYVPTLSKHRHSFLPLLKKKGSQEERRTKVGLLRHRQLPIPGIQHEPDPFRQQEEA